jgi:putative nucleotidyltransferase with HDIG domain
MTMRALVASPDPALREALAGYLGKRGFETPSAGSAAAVVDALGTSLDLAYIDTETGGMELVLKAITARPGLAMFMVCSPADTPLAAMCVQRGALDYVVKPVDYFDLAATVERAARHREHAAASGVERVVIATLEAVVNALEAKDPYLVGHSARVASLAATIAHELGLAEDAVEKVRIAGRLHDLGKIGVRESVLDKGGPLTPDEYAHIKLHVVVGSDILAPLDHLGEVVSYVRTHHEHWDGSGYPAGLVGEAIPVGGRVLCAAEIFDALTTPRPYQEQLAPDEATRRMRQLAGSILDPRIATALEAAVRRRRLVVSATV